MKFNHYNYEYRVREYQNIANLLNKTKDQPSKFRTSEWVEVNDVSNGMYETGKQMEFCALILKSSFVTIVILK